METWTPEHNTYLSYLLDDITGTEEIVKIRKDYCKTHDCIRSTDGINMYYTGSKAEGLDLPGSDQDYMIDMNNMIDIEVSDSMEDLQSTRANKLLIVTDNVPPAFALLQCLSLYNKFLHHAKVEMDDNFYLSSEDFLSALNSSVKSQTHRIHGPSVESWSELEDISKAGKDNVPSILCKDWPSAANEWKDRPRHYGWPSQKDREGIEEFGFHLVPIGHPFSTRKSLEWRLSFSIAERTLVWSFNHTQLQCYALMKLLLKEFVKTNCAEKHTDVLCSYFIKTFLFWQFETTDKLFWQPPNLSGCMIYLLHQFYTCIESGVLRHYFIPRFNLLAIKLTPEAQTELLYLFGKVIEIGMPILEQCKSLSGVFSTFYKIRDGMQSANRLTALRKRRIFYYDESVIGFTATDLLEALIRLHEFIPHETFLTPLVILTRKGHGSTSCVDFAINYLCSLNTTYKCYNCIQQGNKSVYCYMNRLEKNVYGSDISLSKLWLATFLLQQGDYYGSLQKVNDVLSSIPPYAQYYSGRTNVSNDLSKQLYVDTFCAKKSNIISRAKESWLKDMYFKPEEYHFLPRAIQVELCYCRRDFAVLISPFTYAYFLMFLCYHGLGQYDNRDRALRQLVDTVNDRERCCLLRYHSYNIAGHCMLIAGYVEMARSMFLKSVNFTHRLRLSLLDKYNAAYRYLSLM